jgi:hypothetical protein
MISSFEVKFATSKRVSYDRRKNEFLPQAK